MSESLTTRTTTMAVLGPPRIAYNTFLGIAWGGTILSFIFLVVRLYTRLTTHRGHYVDHFFVVAAWLMLLANTIIWQVVAADMYQRMSLIAGMTQVPAIPPESPVHEDTTTYLRASIAVFVLFYTGLWFVKFSFLVFFRRLGDQVRGQNVHWWIVFSFTFVTWVTTFGTIQYDCLGGTYDYIVTHCVSDSTAAFWKTTLLYNMATDVITDAAIITIPVHLLWNVRIDLRQKLALVSIFSLTVFVIIFAIVRAAVMTSYRSQPDQTWLYMWSSIEQTVSILIACSASFRTLFTKREPTSQSQSRKFWPLWNLSGLSGRGLLIKLTGLSTRRNVRRESESGSNQHSLSKGTDFPHNSAGRATTTVSYNQPTTKLPTNTIQVVYEFSATSQSL